MQHGAAEEISVKFIIRLGLASEKVFNIFGPVLVPGVVATFLLLVVPKIGPGITNDSTTIGAWALSFMASCFATILGAVASYGNYKRYRELESGAK